MLTVLQVAYPFAAVGPDAIGGAEQIVHQIDAALVAAGHRSMVIGCDGSRALGELVAIPAVPAVLDDDARRAAWAQYRQVIAQMLASRRIDVVHYHGLDFAEYLPASDTPVLATLHLPADWYPPHLFQLGLRLICVSEPQRRTCPVAPSEIGLIRNGVAVDRFTKARKRHFALCLARVCPEKGLHLALEAAHRAAVPLALAGQVFAYAAHQAYFDRLIAPRLDRQRRFLGPVRGRRKERLIAAARCLLVPSLVEETSSLAAMEALASGTPVVAFRRGALPDIVEDGRTGFLVDSVAEMAMAIKSAGTLDPGLCREAARKRFSAERMTADYLGLYRELAGCARSRTA